MDETSQDGVDLRVVFLRLNGWLELPDDTFFHTDSAFTSSPMSLEEAFEFQKLRELVLPAEAGWECPKWLFVFISMFLGIFLGYLI